MKQRVKEGSNQAPAFVDFDYDNTLYQIDTQRRKVYRKWVEVESARTYRIMSAYSSLQAKKAH